MGLWLLLGLPGYVGGALYKGSFIPDPPPFLKGEYAEYSVEANVTYFVIIGIILLPAFLTAALLIQRRRDRKNSDA
jgi:hypothetical protein